MDVDPNKRYDPDETVVCPYNEVHRVRITRLPYHLLKCAKQYPEEDVFQVCTFNARHVVRTHDMVAHIATCPDKPTVVDFHNVRRGKTALPVNLDWKPTPDETWDDEFRLSDCEGDEEVGSDEDELGSYGGSRRSVRTNNGMENGHMHGQPVNFAESPSKCLRSDVVHPMPSRSDLVRPVPVVSQSRPPRSVPRGYSSAYSTLDTSDCASVRSDVAAQPVSLGATNLELGNRVLAKAAKVGAEERPLDIAAWCDQQATIAHSHVTVGGAGRGQGSVDADVSIKRPSITPSDVDNDGYLHIHRGRGALLSKHVPLRKPGTGARRTSTTSSPPREGACVDATPDARCISVNGHTSRTPAAANGSQVVSSSGGSCVGNGILHSNDVDHSTLASGADVYRHFSTHCTTPAGSQHPHAGYSQNHHGISASPSAASAVSSGRFAEQSHVPSSQSQPFTAAAGQRKHTMSSSQSTRLPQERRNYTAVPSSGYSTRSQPNRSCTSEARIRNIDKLINAIDDLLSRQSLGAQLTASERAMTERRSALVDERRSVVP